MILKIISTLTLAFLVTFWSGCSGKSINISVTVSENNDVQDNLLDPRLGLAVLGTRYISGFFWHPLYIERNMSTPSPEWRQSLNFKTVSFLSSIDDATSILGPVSYQMDQHFPPEKHVVFSKVSMLESDRLMEDFGFLSEISNGVSRSNSIARSRLLSTIKSTGCSLVTFTDYPQLIFYFLILEVPDFSQSSHLLRSQGTMNPDAVSQLPKTEYSILHDIYYHYGFGIKIASRLSQIQSSYVESFGTRSQPSEGVPSTTK